MSFTRALLGAALSGKRQLANWKAISTLPFQCEMDSVLHLLLPLGRNMSKGHVMAHKCYVLEAICEKYIFLN